jgi:hypothetical protein
VSLCNTVNVSYRSDVNLTMWVIKGVTQCGSDKLTPSVSGLKDQNLVVTGERRSSSNWDILGFVPADETS